MAGKGRRWRGSQVPWDISRIAVDLKMGQVTVVLGPVRPDHSQLVNEQGFGGGRGGRKKLDVKFYLDCLSIS